MADSVEGRPAAAGVMLAPLALIVAVTAEASSVAVKMKAGWAVHRVAGFDLQVLPLYCQIVGQMVVAH